MKLLMESVIPLSLFLFSGTAAFFLLPPPPSLPDSSGFPAGSPPGSIASLAGPFGSSGSTGPSLGSAPAPLQLSSQPNQIGTNSAESPSGPPGFQTFNPLRQGIYFKDLADGFDELDSNLGNMKTIPNSNKRSCFKTCLEDEGCAMVVLCTSYQEPVNTSPSGGSPLSGLQMFLPRKKSSNHDCHVFYKVETSPSFSQEEKAKWGSECQYIPYNPKCRSPVLQPGWQKYQEITMTSEQTLIQKYTCMSGYKKTQEAFNEITCDKYGNEVSIGGCTSGGSQGSSQALLPSLGGNDLNPNVALRPDVDECLAGSPCSDIPNSECENSHGGYECLCHDGFTKVENVCVDIDECLVGSPCSDIANTDCENSQGGYECLCHDGFTKVDNVCVDIDECQVGSPCSDIANTDCENSQGGYECLCHDGFTKVDNVCVDIDECLVGSPCSDIANTDCENSQGGYECLCHDGFTKVDNVCVDIDECLVGSPCSDIANTDCENSQGGYECLCHDGFTKVENVCVDIDECLVGSPCSDSICENSQGGYECLCHDGFTKVDNVCVDKDECEDIDCGDIELDCINTPGSYSCTCREGFEKDLFDECMPTGCDQGFTYKKEANLCLYLEYGSMYNFYNSIESCNNNYENARLAILNTPEKLKAAQELIQLYDATWYVWVDAFQTGTEDRYPSRTEEINKWGDGAVISDTSFAILPSANSFLCIEISYFFDFKLAESYCSFSNEPVCEIPIKNCPNTYVFDENSRFCFKLIVQPETKTGAVSKCQASGARLAQTNTDAKIKAVRSEMTYVGYSGGVFVNGEQKHQAAKEYNYWSDQSLIEASLFAPGEPSDPNLALCVQISTVLGDKLGDVSCDTSQAYVCEVVQ